jgi:hypothetical protein
MEAPPMGDAPPPPPVGPADHYGAPKDVLAGVRKGGKKGGGGGPPKRMIALKKR